MGVRVGSNMASLAPSRCLSFGVLIDHLSYESEYAPYNVAHNDLSWLRRCQSPADLLDALNELCGIPSLELAHYTQQQGRGRNGAWSRVADLASLEESVVDQSALIAHRAMRNLRRKVLDRGVYRGSFERFEVGCQAWCLDCRALHLDNVHTTVG